MPRGQLFEVVVHGVVPAARWCPSGSCRARSGLRLLASDGLSVDQARDYLEPLGRDGHAAAPELVPGHPVLARPGYGHRKTTVPTLYVWSDGDIALGRKAAEATERYVTGPYRFEVLTGLSHWIPDEAPDALSRPAPRALRRARDSLRAHRMSVRAQFVSGGAFDGNTALVTASRGATPRTGRRAATGARCRGGGPAARPAHPRDAGDQPADAFAASTTGGRSPRSPWPCTSTGRPPANASCARAASTSTAWAEPAGVHGGVSGGRGLPPAHRRTRDFAHRVYS